MGESRRYRKFTAQQKTEIVLASLRGPKSIARALPRARHLREPAAQVARAVPRGRRRAACRARPSAPRPTSCAGRSPARAGAGAQDDGGGDRGGTLAGLGVSMRVARSRELVAQGRPAAAGRARGRDQPPGDLPAPEAPADAGSGGRWTRSTGSCSTSRARTRPTATGWSPRSRRARARRPGQPQARAAADARAPPAAAQAAREGRRRRPGYFQVTRPDELWHLDMTSSGSPSTAGAT